MASSDEEPSTGYPDLLLKADLARVNFVFGRTIAQYERDVQMPFTGVEDYTIYHLECIRDDLHELEKCVSCTYNTAGTKRCTNRSK